jgi:hypothetical protein
MIWRELRDPIGEANALNLLGSTQLRRRRLSDAARYFEKYIVIFNLDPSAGFGR